MITLLETNTAKTKMEIKIKGIEKNTASVEANLSEKEVLEQKEHAVDHLISTVSVKGFRQGKAPKSIAADHIDPDALSNHILNHVLNDLVDNVIKNNKFKLLGKPVLENIDSKKDNGWTIKVSFPLLPEINLVDYKKLFKKTKTTKDQQQESEQQRTEKIYDILLKNIKIDVPQSVIEEETHYSLQKLTSQAKTLNLTLEKYLEAVKKTLDEVKNEYSKRAEESIKLDLILLQISVEEKIDTTLEEVRETAKLGGIPDSQLGQLKSIMDRRKTIEFLLKL